MLLIPLIIREACSRVIVPHSCIVCVQSLLGTPPTCCTLCNVCCVCGHVIVLTQHVDNFPLTSILVCRVKFCSFGVDQDETCYVHVLVKCTAPTKFQLALYRGCRIYTHVCCDQNFLHTELPDFLYMACIYLRFVVMQCIECSHVRSVLNGVHVCVISSLSLYSSLVSRFFPTQMQVTKIWAVVW